MTDFDTKVASRGSSPGLVQAALGLGAFAIGTTEFATMTLLPDFSRELGVDAPTGGSVISAYALGGGSRGTAVRGVRREAELPYSRRG